MKTVLMLLLIVHGLFHLLGFAKACGFAELSQLTQPIPRTAGYFWLAAAILLVSAGLFMILNMPGWGLLAGAGLILSQILITMSWKDAMFGTVANVLLVLPVIAGILNVLPSSYINRYRADVEQRLVASPEPGLLTEQDIAYLPGAVQNYLRFTGSIGKPKVLNFRVTWTGSMRIKMDGDWLPIKAWQYDFVEDPARLFYIESSMYGIPFDGYHAYVGDSATMQITLGGLLQVVDARGAQMNRGETVTMFNDMCLIAPPTLISPSIRWEEIDPLTVRGIFTNRGNTISAVLSFDSTGALRKFVSNDRYYCDDGKTYLSYPWSTPVEEYREYDGRKVTGGGEALWSMPQGEYAYARYTLVDLEYNCRTMRKAGGMQ